MCKSKGVSRQSADNWADELRAAARIVFGPEKAPAKIRNLEKRNRQLRDRVDLLTRTLSRHGIEIPSIRADELDEEDIGLLSGDDGPDEIPDIPEPPEGPIRPAW